MASNMTIIREKLIGNNYRVTIKKGEKGFPYYIQTEQKATENSYPWEVDEDGWRMCVGETANTFIAAEVKFDQQVISEQRWH